MEQYCASGRLGLSSSTAAFACKLRRLLVFIANPQALLAKVWLFLNFFFLWASMPLRRQFNFDFESVASFCRRRCYGGCADPSGLVPGVGIIRLEELIRTQLQFTFCVWGSSV